MPKKTVLDDWGDAIENIPDEGVFDETSLGDVIDFPNINKKEFPYAPTPEKKVKRVAANKFGLYADDDPQYNGGNMRGMGDNGDWIITGQKEGYTGKDPGVDGRAITGAVYDGIGAGMGLVSGILETVQNWRTAETTREQQTSLFNRRLAEIDAAIEQAQQPLTDRIGITQQGEATSPLVWVAIAGVGIVTVGGIVYMLTRKK